MDELAMRTFITYIRNTFDSVDNLDEKKLELKNSIYFGACFYIDEAQLIGFGSKDSALVNWLTLQRHFNQDIHMITQQKGFIHRDYLPLVHHYRDMMKSIVPNTFGYKDYDGVGGEKLTTKFYTPSKLIFDIYETGKAEHSTNPMVYKLLGIVLLLLLGIGYLFFTFNDLEKVGQPSSSSFGKDSNTFSNLSNKTIRTEYSSFTYLKLNCIDDTCSNRLHHIELYIDELNATVFYTQSKISFIKKYSNNYASVSLLVTDDFINLFQGAKNYGKKKKENNNISTGFN